MSGSTAEMDSSPRGMANGSNPVPVVSPPEPDVGGEPEPPTEGGPVEFDGVEFGPGSGEALDEGVAAGVGVETGVEVGPGGAVAPGGPVGDLIGSGVTLGRGVGVDVGGFEGGVGVGVGFEVGPGVGAIVGRGVGLGVGAGVGVGLGVGVGVGVGVGAGVGLGVGAPATTATVTESVSMPDEQFAWSRDSAGHTYVPTGVPVTRTWNVTTSPSDLTMSASVTAWTQTTVEPDGPEVGGSAVQVCGAESTATDVTLNAAGN